jgi:hypothetical protein
VEKPFYQFLNAYDYNDIGHTEICTAEPLASDTSAYEFEIAVEKTKRHKSPGTDQISTELIKAGVGQFSEIHKPVNSILNNKELPEEWKKSIILPTLYLKEG